MRINEVTGENTRTISDKIRKLNLNGFSGDCPESAISINKNVFQNTGKIVGVFNRAMLDYGKHPLGHVAVLYNGDYWDADAKPKTFDEIESWGMLDPTDFEYEELADDYGFDWNDETASDVIVIEFKNNQSLLNLFHRTD
jgi:hypothetical protein